ncbi:type II toxin-antitoxin system HicA family toxin [Desulfobacula sp.]|uniref:type II toxin-antitoxin system HicA family toxin n=1 Tax=Desulfobacula sp. TaxID=2593537 RepID=UPI001990FC0D|nr:type II toxin-antitoxin system HicA family toxin [Candidatus Brocadiales bacterium]MBL6996490.1 type II toxin-antitoxin system HicA family toxin [Desulfobacula sp.]
MPKLPRLTSSEAEALILKAGYEFARSKGSHRIYIKGSRRLVIPFHAGKMLYPKIIKQVLKGIEPVDE